MIGNLVAGLGVAVVMVLGILGFGRLANSDLQAMVMTTAFFLAVAATGLAAR